MLILNIYGLNLLRYGGSSGDGFGFHSQGLFVGKLHADSEGKMLSSRCDTQCPSVYHV